MNQSAAKPPGPDSPRKSWPIAIQALRAWFFRPRPRWRMAVTVASVVYGLVLGAFLLSLDRLGELCWWFLPLVFLPGQVWLLPLAVLVPLGLACRRRLLWLHALCVVGVLIWYQRPACGSSRPVQGVAVRVVTYNLGHDRLAGLKPFAQSRQAEFIALQEATGCEPDCQREFPDYTLAGRGQFLLLSQHPIRRHDWVPVLGDKYGPVAVRFEVEVQGRSFAIYNVHLVTPRGELTPFPNGSASASRESRLKAIWGVRVDTARRLASVLQRETLPFIVVGDFNTPNRGVIHRLFDGQLQDAFAACGRGQGFTFPADGAPPLGWWGPWLRLDYIYTGRGFQPAACAVETGRATQHRAVGAVLDWRIAD